VVTSVTAFALAGLAVVATGCGGSSHSVADVSAVPLASDPGADTLQQQLVNVVKAVSPSVVQSRARGTSARASCSTDRETS